MATYLVTGTNLVDQFEVEVRAKNAKEALKFGRAQLRRREFFSRYDGKVTFRVEKSDRGQ